MLFFANTQKAPGFESSSASSDNKTKQHTQHGAAYTHALPTSPVELPSGQVCLSVRAAPAQTWQATLTSTAATTASARAGTQTAATALAASARAGTQTAATARAGTQTTALGNHGLQGLGRGMGGCP